MQEGYDPYPSEYNFKYFTRLQSACSYQGKLQTNCAVPTFCDFNHRVITNGTTVSIKNGSISCNINSFCGFVSNTLSIPSKHNYIFFIILPTVK